MTNAPSITTQKSAFLRQQTRLLSTPLQPSPSWADTPTSDSTSDTPTPIPEKTLTDILSKLNTKITSHNRLVFSAQSQRHVAEQIDALYWNEVVADAGSTDAETVWIARDADLTDSSVLAGLPETLGGGKGYEEERRRVLELVERRDELRDKVEGYRRLRELMRPLEDAKTNVQPNLVTRDGELARELERMRVLMARVEGGLGAEDGRDGDRDESRPTETISNQQKLARVLDLR